MANVILTPEAKHNIEEILDDVIEFTGFEQSGIKLYQDLIKKIELIAFMPHIGTYREDGTLETFERNYRIVYEIQGNSIIILTVIHSRKLYPRP